MSSSTLPQAPRAVKRTDRNRKAIEDRLEVQRHEEHERWQAIQTGMLTTKHTNPILARMNEIQHLGTVDTRDGFFRLYQGFVGDELMFAQVTEYQRDLLITFWAHNDGRYRRMLLTMDLQTKCPVTWIAIGLNAIRHTGKYAKAGQKIRELHDFEQKCRGGSHTPQSEPNRLEKVPQVPQVPRLAAPGGQKGGC